MNRARLLVAGFVTSLLVLSQMPQSPLSLQHFVQSGSAAGYYGAFPPEVPCSPAPGVTVPPGTHIENLDQVKYMISTNQIVYEFFWAGKAHPTTRFINVFNRSTCHVTADFFAQFYRITQPVGHPGRYAEQELAFEDGHDGIPAGHGLQFSYNGPGCALQIDLALGAPGAHIAGFEEAHPLNPQAQNIPLCPKTPAPTTNNAICTLSAPASVTAGSTFTATFTLTNNGTKTWKAGSIGPVGNYHLMSRDPIDNGTWGTARIQLPHDVAPGQSVTVNATMTAPGTIGNQLFSFEMGEEGVGRFGNACQKTINVTPSAPNCVIETADLYNQYKSQGKIIDQVQPNGSWNVTNNTTCVLKAHVSIWKVNQGGDLLYKAQTLFSTSGTKQVMPGTTMNISSATPGCQYQTDLGVGDGPFNDVNGVIQGSPLCTANENATCTVNAPSSVMPGQQFSVSFNLTNTGDSWWFNTGLAPYRLGSTNPIDNNTFGAARIGINGFVRPGESQTLSFTATAPSTSGVYNLDWEMLREGLYRFGQVCHKTITVGTTSSSSSSSSAAPQCRDNVDNDNDGATDYPSDFSCSGPDDNDELIPRAACHDGQDNDNDGLVDFPQDPGCSSRQDNDEFNQSSSSSSSSAIPQCRDNVDNDNDGATDYPSDFSCSGPDDNDELIPRAACHDGQDNDNDGLVDFPQDPGCSSRQDNDEFNQASSSSSSSSAIPQCRDNVDNDGDGATDMNDFSCSTPDDNDETNPKSQCQDGIDNDNDGLTDFPNDPGCLNRQDNDEFNQSSSSSSVSGADIGLTVVSVPSSVTQGSTASYTFNVFNNGPQLAQNVRMFLTVPSGFSLAAGSSCNQNGTTVTCPLGNMNNGTSQQVIAMFQTGGVSCNNTVYLSGSVTSDTVDPNTGNNQLSQTLSTFVSCQSSSSSSSSSSVPQCRDGLDNDGDGATDMSDFSCSTPDDNDETNPKSQCQDGIDNDNDGLTDFPSDPGCSSRQDNDENNQTSTLEQCRDGIDNDADGRVDSNDPGCHFDNNPGNPQSYNPYRNSEADNMLLSMGSININVTNNNNSNAESQSNPVVHSQSNPDIDIEANPQSSAYIQGEFIGLMPQTGVETFTAALVGAPGSLTPVTSASAASAFSLALSTLGISAGGILGRRFF